ncbi:mitochondrial mRNA pseudouridine synthase RPUSD3 [Pseudophryne corroboree]|uniref:mitochondrial mRNA pseudouridine synthase RPUSD3 n=1 Tax=Pseudophryne corroboree TaxID=495146 RepID=UPI00308186C5
MDLLCRQLVLRRLWLSLPVSHHPCFRGISIKSSLSLPWYHEHLGTRNRRERGHKSPIKVEEHNTGILRTPGVVPVDKLTKETLCQLLAQNVVFREGPLVAINKPQGLRITESSSETSVMSLLPELQQLLQIESELQVVKAAPKQSSGLVLLSSCHVTTKRLEDYYTQCRKSRKPFTTFCAITLGVPSPAEGDVKVVLKVEQIGDLDLAVPVMHPTKGSLERREVKRTETCYKVLNSVDECSLLQLQPMTTFQDQLLVHCTLKFCPVLGDHTYSARVAKVLGQNICVPVENALPKTQLVDESILRRMHFPLHQVHRMPLHLHLHQLLMPSDRRGQYPAQLTAPPPPFFQKTMELLGLKMEK